MLFIPLSRSKFLFFFFCQKVFFYKCKSDHVILLQKSLQWISITLNVKPKILPHDLLGFLWSCPRLPFWFNFSSHSYLNSFSATLASCQVPAPLKAFVLVLSSMWKVLSPNYHLPRFLILWKSLLQHHLIRKDTYARFTSYALSYFIF